MARRLTSLISRNLLWKIIGQNWVKSLHYKDKMVNGKNIFTFPPSIHFFMKISGFINIFDLFCLKDSIIHFALLVQQQVMDIR